MTNFYSIGQCSTPNLFSQGIYLNTTIELNLSIMPLQKGTKRYKHNQTGEVRYFRNPPNLENWSKIGTPGSKDWRWVHNMIEERFIHKEEVVPEGFIPGRLKV